MTLMSGLGILLSLVFGCLLFALVAELYYLLFWKKQRICSNSNRIEANYGTHKNKEFFYLFCWDKFSSIITHPQNSNTIVANPENTNNDHNDPDVEPGLGSSKDLLLRAFGEDGEDSEMMRLYNLAGPPRFLFTINEETKEDLESEDGKLSRKGSKAKGLGEFEFINIMAPEIQSPFCSPMASPPLKVSMKSLLDSKNKYENPLFESSVEAEINRCRSSPPPKFRFLRNAEEKLYRRLLEEAQKSRDLKEAVMENKDGCLKKIVRVVNGEKKNKERELLCSSLQVLPLAASPSKSK